MSAHDRGRWGAAFGAAVGHELLRVRRDRALRWLLTGFAVTCAYAAYQGHGRVVERRVAVAAIQAQADQFRAEAEARMRHAVAQDTGRQLTPGFFAATLWYHPTLPVRPMAALATGQMEGYPYEAKFHPLTNITKIFGALGISTRNPAAGAAGHFDIGFVVVFLLPLVLLAATYDVWTHERELNTADFVLAQPVAPGAVLAAKAVVRGGLPLASLTLVVLLTHVGALVALGGTLDELLGMADALAWVAAIVALYGGLWVLIALAVNVYARTTTAAAVACGALWLALVAAVPALLSVGAAAIRPMPSGIATTGALRHAETESRARVQARSEEAKAALASAGQDVNARLHAELVDVWAAEAEYLPIVDAFQAQEAAHRRVAERLRFVSPAVAVQDALERVAGTDADRALDFQRQVRAYVEELRRFMLAPPAENGTGIDAGFGEVPTFVFRERHGAAAVTPMALDVAAVLAFSAVVLGALGAGVRRRVFTSNE